MGVTCELKARDMCHDHYLVASCALHNLQTCLRNAIINVMGEGGKDDNGEYVMNCMQMLHGAYNIQNWEEHDKLKEIYEYLHDEVMDKKLKKLEEPVVT